MKNEITAFEGILVVMFYLVMVLLTSFCWETGKIKAQIRQDKIFRVISPDGQPVLD